MFKWLSRLTEPQPDVILLKSRWADHWDPKDGHSLREFAVRLGFYATGLGAGGDLYIEHACKAKYVYEPHVFKVRSEYLCIRSQTHRTFQVRELVLNAERYTVAAIMDATVEALRTSRKTYRKEELHPITNEWVAVDV